MYAPALRGASEQVYGFRPNGLKMPRVPPIEPLTGVEQKAAQ
tara:strand:+ start:267 stop:392 length:126 start_codon:yes stop_codon:yes gene_type:complete